MSFTTATGVAHRADNTWVGRIEPGWDIFGMTNGGYLMAMTARAMANLADQRSLVTISAHFTNAAQPGPVIVEAESVKTGKSITTTRARLRADDRTLITTIASFSERREASAGGEIVHASPPMLPPPEECVRAVPSNTGPLPPPFMGKVDLRLHPEDAAALRGERTGIARVRGWFRLLEDTPCDPFAMVLASDAFPPAVFNTNLPLSWTPTLSMTVDIRNPEPKEMLRCQFRTRFVAGGLLEEDGEIWDSAGNLVAQSRQLALVPR